jgi:hypothetical protein
VTMSSGAFSRHQFSADCTIRALLHGYGYALAFGREEAVEGGS